MIRKATINDIQILNEIGKQIKDDLFNEEINTKEFNIVYVYEENEEIKGFIEIEKHFEIIDIVNISTNINYKRSGIATELVNYVINNNDVEKIMLEVRESNESAINFYKKNDFKEIHIRKNYYGNEDAIIMERIV